MLQLARTAAANVANALTNKITIFFDLDNKLKTKNSSGTLKTIATTDLGLNNFDLTSLQGFDSNADAQTALGTGKLFYYNDPNDDSAVPGTIAITLAP